MQHEIISIIGGGWSLRELHPEGRSRIPGYKIGVNDSCTRLVVDEGLTMDRLWIEGRWAQLRNIRLPVWVRDSALRNIVKRPVWLNSFSCDHETVQLSDDPGRLNGPNSGHCAINLAYQRRPRRIILWGFDMNRAADGAPYWYPAYPWSKAPQGNTSNRSYSEWATGFEVVAAQCKAAGIEIINASLVSAITSIPKVDPWTLLV